MKTLKDYSFIRGVCYGWTGDQETIVRDMGYAKRLLLNSARIWLRRKEYDESPEAFIRKLTNYVRTAHSFGLTTMPILWNGNMLDTSILEERNWPQGEAYVKAVVEALRGEAGLLMWDIMNEPTCNDYWRKSPPEEKTERDAKLWKFVRHYIEFVKSIDGDNAVTVGNTFIDDTEPTADLVDVISFHDYLETRKRVEASYVKADAFAARYGKPLINSELACLCRSNPYDMALEACERHNVGWYLFELMVHGYWGDVHGIVYPDGTVRDPSIVAAIYGFHRKRDRGTAIKPNPNKEGHAHKALQLLEETMRQDTTLFQNKRKSSDEILEAAEYCANLLEGAEMVPMYDPPTARINEWRKQPEEERDLEAIRAFAYRLAQTLKKYCQVF